MAKRTQSDQAGFVGFGYLVLTLGLGGFIAWANVVEIASAVVAPGTVVVASNRKTIQHLEGGIVQVVEAMDGKAVVAGEILMRLDGTQAIANLEAIRVQLDAARATEARLAAESMGLESMDTSFMGFSGRGSDAPIADQIKLFEMRRGSLIGQTDIMDARIEQLARKAAGWEARAGFLREEAGNYQEQLDGISSLVRKGLHPRNAARELERRISAINGDISEAEAEGASARSTISETRLQKEQAVYLFREKASEELAKVRETIAGLNERLDIAKDVHERTNIRAPQDGIVQGLRFHAKGEVIKPGEPILEIVPVGDELLVEVLIPATSIDQVHLDAETEIRFPSFSSRETPIILGRLTKVSADAVPDKDGMRQSFLGRIEVLRESIPTALAGRLQPGMPAEVVMVSGNRTVMSYILKPLVDSMSRGMRER